MQINLTPTMPPIRTEAPDSLPAQPRVPRALVTAGGNLALAVIYLAVAQLSLSAATEHRVVSSVWPPAGIALFVLLRYGIRFWPGVTIGAFLLNASSGVTPIGALFIAVGDTLESLVAAIFVGRVMGKRRTLSRVSDVVSLTLIGGAVCTMIAASVGVTTLVASGGTTLASAWSLWLVWWTGDAVGVLVVTPFLLAWSSPDSTPSSARWGRLEVAALFLALAVMTDALFAGAGALVFAIYPLALLISWRFGPRAAATACTVVTLIATWRTLSGSGPFTAYTPTVNLYTLQFFLGLLAVVSLVFAASRAEGLYGEARLRASETRYRMLAQKLPDGCVVLYDRDLRLLLVEGPAIAGAGFTKEGVEGKRLTDIFDAEHAAALSRPFGAPFAGQEAEFEFAYLEKLYLVRVLPVQDIEENETIGMALALDVTARDRAQREVAESQAQLEQLSRLLLTAQEDERRRVAREVHDELGQALTAVKIGLSHTLSRAQRRNSLESERRARNATDLLDQAIASVQRIVLRLRPGVLDNLGPLAALEHEVQQFREQSGLHVSLALPPEDIDIRADHSTVLYRTVQESLTNVLRHAQARRVAVTLCALEHELLLQVADDGIGISADQLQKPRSMGLLGMRERAAACGGRVEIARLKAGGTCVSLRIPTHSNGRPAV